MRAEIAGEVHLREEWAGEVNEDREDWGST
jgi:hypothetical protein